MACSCVACVRRRITFAWLRRGYELAPAAPAVLGRELPARASIPMQRRAARVVRHRSRQVRLYL